LTTAPFIFVEPEAVAELVAEPVNEAEEVGRGVICSICLKCGDILFHGEYGPLLELTTCLVEKLISGTVLSTDTSVREEERTIDEWCHLCTSQQLEVQSR
jgi:hypothetical protein